MVTFSVNYLGEFSPFLQRLNKFLLLAKESCSNELQAQMIQCYIQSFQNGDINKHKESQKYWVLDKKPVVETNIGWIDSYVDPLGVRASYEVINF